MNQKKEFNGRLIVKYPEKNLPERIRKYVTGVYQYLDSTVDYQGNILNEPLYGQYEIDRNLQIYYLILKNAEKTLSKLAKEKPNSSYFKNTMENPMHKAAFDKLNAGEEGWFCELSEITKEARDNLGLDFVTRNSKKDGKYEELLNAIMISGRERCEFPYFLFYCIDNGLKPLEALKGIFRNDPLTIRLLQSIEASDDFNPRDFDYMKIGKFFSWGASENRTSSYYVIKTHLNKSTQYCDYRIVKDGHEHDSPYNRGTYRFVIDGPRELFNSNLLQDKPDKEIVFVTEYIHAANYLEKIIIDNYVEYIKDTILNIENKGSSEISIHPSYDVPAGDCIWVAPVGGYCCPWFSNWSVLEGREVYIFKVGEKNPHKYLKELADVLDAIHQQFEMLNQQRRESNQQEAKPPTIRFVVFPTKVLPNNNPNDDNGNNIEILSVEDFFVQCKKNKIKIPETLRDYYGKIMRKRTNARADEFIVEPFFRKNDWILLTGEEGSGKSFFSIALGMAIANNRKMMFSDWKLRRKSLKVLYITDAEMKGSIIKDRLATFRHIYNTRDNGLFLYEQVKYCNLTNEDEQQKMEKTIADYTNIGKEDEPVSVVIFDHLLKLTDAQGDEEDNWKKFRTWLDKLTEELHLSVILVHHEYAGTKMLGTRLIANDVGTRLHFEDYLGYMARELSKMPKRREEDRKEYDKKKKEHDELEKQTKSGHIINIGVTIVKNRGGEKDRKPRYLGISMEEQSMYYDIDDITSTQTGHEMQSSTTRKWKGMTEEEKIAFLKASLDEGKTWIEMAAMVGMSTPTIAKAIGIFRKEGKLPKSNRRTNKTTDKVEDTNADTQTDKTDN